MGTPNFVVFLRVGRSKTIAPDDVVGGIDGTVVVEVAGEVGNRREAR
jgi:hypothetical protein